MTKTLGVMVFGRTHFQTLKHLPQVKVEMLVLAEQTQLL
jgi:hypothetical protein